MSKSKNDSAWERIFEKKKNILAEIKSKGQVEIYSKDINKLGEREARLMTKFDHELDLPSLFKENKLSILPISRGTYVIGYFEIFHLLNKDGENGETTEKCFPIVLQSINCKEEITKESTAIDYAFISKILHDFTEEEELYLTVRGRMGSSSFDFKINSNIVKGQLSSITVNKAQIEIDGGYEGKDSLYLIEAKIETKTDMPDDFIIRQLYYPYRLWKEKISKQVRPIFLIYSNGTFYLREYEFTNLELYNSIHLVKYKKYTLLSRSHNQCQNNTKHTGQYDGN